MAGRSGAVKDRHGGENGGASLGVGWLLERRETTVFRTCQFLVSLFWMTSGLCLRSSMA